MNSNYRLAKRVASYAAVAYLAVGIALGSLLYSSIPAMNLAGWGYYALTWPVFICHGSNVCKGTPYVPHWAFTFKEVRQS